MKQGQFSQEQIIALVRQAEKGEQTIQAICRQPNITETTFYRGRKLYGGMSVAEAQRLKALERENSRLKRLLAERALAGDALRELLSKKEPSAGRNARTSAFSRRKGSPNDVPVRF